MPDERKKVEKRKDHFTQQITTRIWRENPCPENPYLSQSASCYGYDLLELVNKRSFTDVFFLIFRGKLPTSEQAELLEKLMITLINPGTRHPAARAAMVAAVGKTPPVHILPISLNVLGGRHLGAGCVEDSMRFFRKNQKKSPEDVISETIERTTRPNEGDWHPVPGFGSRFCGIDPLPRQFAKHLASLSGAKKSLQWGEKFATLLHKHDLGWLAPGVAAAVFSDLGFQPRAGAGLFQLLSAPGLLAHGLEYANKPITAMPFPTDEKYVIESD